MTMKDREEVDLIADYEIEYGDPDNWDEITTKEFDEKWDAIQMKYKGRLAK